MSMSAGVQMGIEPTLFELDNDDFPLALSAPQELGLSINDYYENDDDSDETFGYFTTGLTGTLPLPFIDASFGGWTANCGISPPKPARTA